MSDIKRVGYNPFTHTKIKTHFEWLEGWEYRMPVNLVGGASGVLTDYQLNLSIPYDPNMEISFDDLRFTALDGETLLNSWLESKTDGVESSVWVNFPSTPAHTISQKVGYLYFSNPNVSNIWDGEATFLNFDGFEDGSTTNAGDMWVFGSNYASSAQAHSGDYSFTIPNAQLLSQPLGEYTLGTVGVTAWGYFSVTSGRQLTWVVLDSDGDRETDSAVYLKFEDAKTYAYYSGVWNDLSLPFTTGWNRIDIVVGNTTSDVTVGGNTNTGISNRNTISNIDKIHMSSTSSLSYMDDNFVRKYAANPPTYEFGVKEYY